MYVMICPICHKNNKESWIYTSGFDVDAEKQHRTKCVTCGGELQKTVLTVDEYSVLEQNSIDASFFDAMIDLKQKDPIEFQLKMSQFRTQVQQQESSKVDNTPKCPTCGSTNIKSISSAKRWFTTGIFGLASSNVGKTMECKNCGYKW